MENYSIYLPSYTIGEKSYLKIAQICERFGKKVVVIGGEKAIKAFKEEIAKVDLRELEILDYLYYGGEASFENVEMLKANAKVKDCDMVFAVGGGKALDTCKALCEMLDKYIFTFPTIAATCAATTAVAIMYYPDGRFNKPFFLKKSPNHCFINLNILVKAPSQYMWAGIGDTIAKHYESSVSARGDELAHYHNMGVVLSKLCAEPILQYGTKAMEDNKKQVVSKELNEVVLAIIVTTGICSNCLTADKIIDYNTGLGHAIFYALTSFKHVEENHLHGEVVAFGILILLLCDKNMSEFEKVYNFCKSINLPTKLADVELDVSVVDEVIEKTIVMKDIEHNPYKITKEMLKEAFNYIESLN